MRDKQKLTYFNILNDTLRKKRELLRQLTDESAAQEALFEAEPFDMDAFESHIGAKDKLLARLNDLDDGFMDLYGRLKEAMSDGKADYEDEIKEAQELIREVTELSVSLQALEERNRQKLGLQLTKGRTKVRDFRVNSRTAAAYYKNMSGRHQEGDSYFFNRKK